MSFFIICMASTPLNIEVAVLNDLNPNIERTRFLIKQWSCSIILLRYLTCLSCICLQAYISLLSTLESLQNRQGFFIYCYHARCRNVRKSQDFLEKALGCLLISWFTLIKINGITFWINGTIQIHPLSFTLI